MDMIKFKINGLHFSVGCEVSSDVTLLDYLRNYLQLRGTKYMCREGGCGACIVSVHQPAGTSYAVNSCLMLVTSCHGLEITTIEGLGNRLLQKTLADENGTQCGYCTPAWVMSMYSLLQGNPNISMLNVEKSLSSNICRCTGYRPILQAFKKFASDAPRQITLPDIENLKLCNKTEETCDKSNCEDSEWCFVDLPADK
ncbi:xanthine dehydrogenase/oxidase-like [Spodoptera frugiperda]|uniref:Xanthine dehydrogenase/oxidase-like n=1 Tax=Spodoptera frugiperda TaxID=7108 RepID=A0A9R0DN48_SPOFR|nr:xanthine dehydrogenase/oxidase-like [Spodoptera frugiperda]